MAAQNASSSRRDWQFSFHKSTVSSILVALIWFSTAHMYLHGGHLHSTDVLLHDAGKSSLLHVQVSSLSTGLSTSSQVRNLKYVVFSTSLDTVARQQDYSYLSPLVAQSWSLQGFHPIILVVFDKDTTYKQVLNDWRILLPSDAILIPIPKVPSFLAVTVAQIARLYTAHLIPDLPDNAFLRITDGDMMISNGTAFAPPEDDTDITIFNGQCCLGEYKLKINKNQSEESCTQYPMHSVGMNVDLWRSLFIIDAHHPTEINNIQQSIIEMSNTMLEAMTTQEQQKNGVQHGGLGWSTDQMLLGCAVTKAVKQQGKNLVLPEGQGRLHVWNELPSPGRDVPLDIHLASFRIAKHHYWMNRLVNQTSILLGVEQRYYTYSHRWMQRYNITPHPYVRPTNVATPRMQIKVKGISFQ